MTSKTTPRHLFPKIASAYMGDDWEDNPTNEPPQVYSNPDENTTRWEWDVDLTPEEEAAFDAAVLSAKSGIDMQRYADIRTELSGLRNYYLLDTPTNAQSIQAIKAIIKVLRAMLKDE